MFGKIKSSLSNSNNRRFLNSLLLVFLIYFIYSYFLKLNYVLNRRDEIYYLGDSLLLLEGIRPSFSHSPSGISTWLGSIVVLIDFIINKFSFHNLGLLFENFDLTLFKHYKNLTYIKISLFVLNTFLLIYLYILDKKKIIFLSFFTLFLLPEISSITFSGKPYFLASVFFIISLLLNDKNKLLSLIFYGLAISERIEFLVLINFICLDDNKISFKNYLIVFIILFAVSPWFSMALIQNLKTYFTVIYFLPGYSDQSNLFLSYIAIIGFITINFSYNLFKNNKIKKIFLLLLILIILQLSLMQKIPIRWLMPSFIILIYELHFYLLKKEQFSKIGLMLAVFLLLTNFNMQKFQSDDQLLKNEMNSSYTDIIGVPLLKEELNFQNYNKLFGSHIKKHNIKNIHFFKNDNAALTFGKSGNLEILVHRRYEFLSKYNFTNLPNKYIASNSGINWNIRKWCSVLNNKDVAIFFQNKIIACEKF